MTSAFGKEFQGRQFVGFTDFAAFTRETRGGELVLTSPEIRAAIDWDELIVSWNAPLAADGFLTVEVRGVFPGHATKFYTLGLWSPDAARHPRESVKSQADADGDVQTDTLVLKRRGAAVVLRVTLGSEGSKAASALKFLGLSFCDTRAKPERDPATSGDRVSEPLPVPERSQMVHSGGQVWCSPASVSMVLAHWSRVLKRPELDVAVPDVAQAVFDRNWPGTGNWPFNTAFAGAFPGMRAYVTRLGGIGEIERWIRAGVPVIVSVSYGELKGTGKRPNDGHLVVCVGFTQDGEAVINDPGTRENVRKVFPRANLEKAWAASRHTVYLIHPENLAAPEDRHGHWFRR